MIHAASLVFDTIPSDRVSELVDPLQPHDGIYPIPGLESVDLLVDKTTIKDQDGNMVNVVE